MKTSTVIVILSLIFISFYLGAHLGYNRGVLLATSACNDLEISQMKAILDKNTSRDVNNIAMLFLESAERLTGCGNSPAQLSLAGEV